MRHGAALGLLALAAFAAPRALRAEPVLVGEESNGSYDVAGETRLVVQGLTGTLSLRLGKPGLLRFEARSLDDRREPRPVALWLDDERTLRLAPAAGRPNERILIDAVLPPGLKARVEAADSRVMASGLDGDFDLRGERVEAQLRGLHGAAAVVLHGGKVNLDGVAHGLKLTGSDLEVDLQHVTGGATLELTRGRIKLIGIEGDVDGEFEAVDVDARQVIGRLQLDARGGQVALTECTGGGRLHLDQSPLVLARTGAAFDVRTNASVRFEQHEGPLAIASRGAELRGSQITGPLRVEGDEAQIVLENLIGESEVHGSGLKVKITTSKGRLSVQAASSEISVEGIEGELVIENDYGDIEVRNVRTPVRVASRGGAVRLSGMEGPLQVSADGPEVEVGWVKLGSQENSTLANESGDLRLQLPASGRYQVVAEAPFGRVESALPGVPVSDDGHSATGEFAGGGNPAPQLKKPVIQARSGGGNVYLGPTAAADANRQ